MDSRGPTPLAVAVNDEPERARKNALAVQAAPVAAQLAARAALRGWGSPHDALSAAMEAVRIAVNTFDEKRGVPIQAWARLKIKDRLRSQRRATAGRRKRERRADVDVATVAVDTVRPEAAIGRAEFWSLALRGLTPPQAEAVRAVFRDGLTRAEAGERLGVSGKTVQSRIEHAKATLRANLGGYRDLAV